MKKTILQYIQIQRILLIFLLLLLPFGAHAQIDSITRNWTMVSRKTNENQALIRIFRAADGLYYGKIEKMYKHVDAHCDKCEGKDKGKPLLGMMIIRGMKAENGILKEGYVLDPLSGKKYYGTISYDTKTEKLKLRGSLDKRGVLGMCLYWIKSN